MSPTHDITVAYGDGIGPEIMDATLRILAEARAQLNIETIEVGEAYYKKGLSTGIPSSAWETLRRTKVLLKAPITTPQGGGYKSLNVTMRKTLGLYANIRPTKSYHPFVKGLHAAMDLVIVRENEEDLYSGIEYQQTADAFHAVKLITHTGSERIIRYAYEYAVKNGRKKVTCMSKDNIMKICDGAFHRIFDEVGAEYPEVQKEHYIIDIGAARIASHPEKFDVIVTENLYGDIISDIAAEVCGSVGLAGSSNVGEEFAMFEAIHGSAPDIAGQNIANPSGLLNGAIMMLVHLGQFDTANLIQNAWLKTIEDGIHTGDIYHATSSKEKVGTKEFADAVIAHLGEEPYRFKRAEYGAKGASVATSQARSNAIVAIPVADRVLKGVDVYIGLQHKSVENLGEQIQSLTAEDATLTLISSKGLKVWPDAEASGSNTDHVRCRFMANGEILPAAYTGALLSRLSEAGLDVLKMEHLYNFDGKAGYSLSAGE
ncbi:MAG: NADP-dependent isocitrate dehydrogenase [Rickettsiales bacterium]|nr:NADP-dependent isocitrate dehydrogenase [Rickettsiales bacterium]